MRWLTDCSPASLSAALRVVAPGLGDAPIEMRTPVAQDDPLWWSSTAVVDGRFIAKFAWSEPAARRVAYEIGVLTALAGEPFLPEVVAGSTDPVLLLTRRVPGASLFEVVHSIDRDRAGNQLAGFLAALHRPPTRARVEAAVGHLPDAHRGPQHPTAARVLRDRLGPWVRPDQRPTIMAWCDWADATLAQPGPSVLVHADLHGDNQVWTGDRLRLVVDFETVSAAEPEYDLRALPATGPGVELLTATMRHYEHLTGRRLAIDRVMAWHLRTALGDALWRSEAGIPLPDHRTPAAWVDDLAIRFRELGIDTRQG
jgi:aminoglycoside phosphotransferase (APT) family kinase protein